MSRHPREKPSTDDLLHGTAEKEDAPRRQQFGDKRRQAEKSKIQRTAQLRAGETSGQEIESLPVGQVTQVYSLYCQVRDGSGDRLCVVRKTLAKLARTAIVVGDEVRFRDGKPGEESVIEQILPRRTVLTRTDSFLNTKQHPIVANAEQMLIVASLVEPAVKWGLIDRMIVAAQSGKLTPIVCLNKSDLSAEALQAAQVALDHYAKLGVASCKTSATTLMGLDDLRTLLTGKSTVLAGHSGVGKSSLISALEPGLDIRIGRVSDITFKGRHTTTGARRYDLSLPAAVIDTPGVRHFGLWGVTRENLIQFFPDVQDQTAPDWRRESFQRIADTL